MHFGSTRVREGDERALTPFVHAHPTPLHVPLVIMNVHSGQLHLHPGWKRIRRRRMHVRLVQTRVPSGLMVAISG